MLKKIILAIFLSETMSLRMEVHMVSLMAFVTKCEIYSEEENQELKWQLSQFSKSSSEKLRLVSQDMFIYIVLKFS